MVDKTKFTPGPWHTGGTFNPGTPAAKQNIWGTTPAGKQSGSVIAWDVAIRNAPLIAAAPELYAALAKLPLDSFDGNNMADFDAADFVDNARAFFDCIQAARAAMAKARGEA